MPTGKGRTTDTDAMGRSFLVENFSRDMPSCKGIEEEEKRRERRERHGFQPMLRLRMKRHVSGRHKKTFFKV